MKRQASDQEDRWERMVSAFPWPLRPPPGDDLPAVSEPRESPPLVGDFGEGPCGEAAARHWAEHVDSPLARLLGPSPAHYRDLQVAGDRCRAESHPRFGGPCGDEASVVFAYVIIDGDSAVEAERRARIVQRLCAALREPLLDVIRDPEIDLP